VCTCVLCERRGGKWLNDCSGTPHSGGCDQTQVMSENAFRVFFWFRAHVEVRGC